MEPQPSTHEDQAVNGHKPPVLDNQEPSIIPVTSVSATVDPSPTLPESPPQHPRRKWILFSLLSAGLVVGAVFGDRWWHFASVHESTDDAYVTTDIHPINARMNGTVIDVEVNDNQTVSQGDVLVKLDPRDYEVAQQQATAALESAKQQAAVA